MKPVKPTPANWTRLSSGLVYDDPALAIDWLCRAFDFEIRMVVKGDDGTIVHSELTYGEAILMVAGPSKEKRLASPRSLGGLNTQHLMLYVDDVKAHAAKARVAGARIVIEPALSDYGEEHWADLAYLVEDVGGHRWWFAERVRNPPQPPSGSG